MNNHRGLGYLALLAFMLSVISLNSQAQSVSFNLKNADIRSVIDMVSGITGKNFIIDPRVKGKVTLVSSTPVEPEDVYDIFLSIMKVHGYVALQAGGVVNIMPANEGVRGAPLGAASTEEDGQMQVRVVSVENVKATQLVPSLKPLMSKNGHLSAHSSSNSLVISDTGRRVERLIDIVRRLDVKEDSGLEAIKLEHAAASQVIKTLQPLLANGGQGKGLLGGPQGSGVKLTADDRSNTVLMMGNKYLRDRLSKLIKKMDVPIAHQGETRVIYLKFAKAVDLAEVLSNTLSEKYSTNKKSTKSANQSATRQVSIHADEDMNALLVTAGPDQHAEIQTVINALDVRRAQVLVESLIVEMSDDKARSLGIQWMGGQDDLIGASGVGALASSALQQGNLVGLLKGARGLNIGLLARALANDGDANIISTPSLITLDNAEAEITVGREVPFMTGSYTSSSNGSSASNPFTTIERNDVGLTMKITPQINQGSAIRLDIDQEISNILPGAATQFGASDVVTSKRSIKTSVVVEDGNILVLGGLVDDTLRETQVKIPVLGDVPVLGGLFNYREATKEKRNLMIFIRTKILRDADSSQQLSEQKYARMRGQQLQKYQAGSRLLTNDDIPVLALSPNHISQTAVPLTKEPQTTKQTKPRVQQHTPLPPQWNLKPFPINTTFMQPSPASEQELTEESITVESELTIETTPDPLPQPEQLRQPSQPEIKTFPVNIPKRPNGTAATTNQSARQLLDGQTYPIETTAMAGHTLVTPVSSDYSSQQKPKTVVKTFTQIKQPKQVPSSATDKPAAEHDQIITLDEKIAVPDARSADTIFDLFN